MYDKTLCPDQFGDILNNKIFTPPQKRYKSIDPFETKSQLNKTPESFNQTTIFKNPNLEFEQVQETLPNKSNQIIILLLFLSKLVRKPKKWSLMQKQIW